MPQLLADARRAGQIDAVEATLNRRLAREHFIRDIFAAASSRGRFGLAWNTASVPIALRLRLFVYAACPGLLWPSSR